jgi:hypothetical protein
LPHHPNRVHLFYSDTLPAKEIVRSTLRMKLAFHAQTPEMLRIFTIQQVRFFRGVEIRECQPVI